MYKQVSKLIVYRDLGQDSILIKLAEIFEDFDWYKANVLGSSTALSASKVEELKDKKHISKESLITRIYEQMKRLLDLATDYGFDTNLWHNYLTFVMMTNENSFTLTSEKIGANDGSVNHFDLNYFNYMFINFMKLKKSWESIVFLPYRIIRQLLKRRECITTMYLLKYRNYQNDWKNVRMSRDSLRPSQNSMRITA